MEHFVAEGTEHNEQPAGRWLIAGVAAGAAMALALVVLLGMIFRPNAPAEALSPPGFVDETTTSGIDHTYVGGFRFSVGGGVAVFDCDGDHKPEVYLAGGAESASLYRNESPIGGALRFTQVPSIETDLTEVTGAYPIDIDGDGVTDLVVLRVGENVVLRGLGDCRFTRANEEWGIEGGDEWTVAFSAQWEGAESLPTLVFGNYAGLNESQTMADGCEDHHLVRPRDGAYGDSIVLRPGYCTLSVLFSDWSGSGFRDLRMANDRHYYVDGQEQLWRVRPGVAPSPYTETDGWERMQIWGMGIASYDVTGDGLNEVFLTSQGDNKLQVLANGPQQPRYEDIAFSRGATAHRPYEGDTTFPSTAWHPEFRDVNNDGFVDLFISKGNVGAQEGYAAEDPNNLLMGGPDGTFTEAGAVAGVSDGSRGRGAALADFNLDGMLDLVVVNRADPVRVWRNVGWGGTSGTGRMGHWVAFDVQQPSPNRDAIGGWIEVRAGDQVQRRELTVGGGHAGGQLGWVHFGLGSEQSAEVRVIWPDGQSGPWMEVAADGFFVIDRQVGDAAPWLPAGG